MALFILDASVAISWCFPGDPTENTPYSRAILSRLAADDAIDCKQHFRFLQQAKAYHRKGNPLTLSNCHLDAM